MGTRVAVGLGVGVSSGVTVGSGVAVGATVAVSTGVSAGRSAASSLLHARITTKTISAVRERCLDISRSPWLWICKGVPSYRENTAIYCIVRFSQSLGLC